MSIGVAAAGDTEGKVRLNDVAHTHYRRELSKVIIYLPAKSVLHSLTHSH